MNILKEISISFKKKDNILLSLIYLVFPLFSIPLVWSKAKNGNFMALVFWSSFLALIGLLMLPSNDVINHFTYYSIFQDDFNQSFFIAWKHDFLLTFFQYYLAYFNIPYIYIVYLFVLFGSFCNYYLYLQFINKFQKSYRNDLFLIFLFLFPLFSIITGLRNGLAIQFLLVGVFFLFQRNSFFYSSLFFTLACITHFFSIFIVILVILVYNIPLFYLIQKKYLFLFIISGSLFIYFSTDFFFNLIQNNFGFVDKVDNYSIKGELDYIATKSFKWQVLFFIRKYLFLAYVYFFFRCYVPNKFNFLVTVLIILVIGTINFTIINNRLLLLTTSFIGLAIILNPNTVFDFKAYKNVLMLSFLLFLVQSYSKFLLSTKLTGLVYLTYPALFLDPYTNEELYMLNVEINR